MSLRPRVRLKWLIIVLALGFGSFFAGVGARKLPALLTQPPDLMAAVPLAEPIRGPGRILALGPVKYAIGDSLPLLGEGLGLIEDVAVDSQGNLTILDSRLARLQVYSPAGELVSSIGGPGRGPGEFAVPRSVAVSPGKVYVLDGGNRRISEYALAAGSAVHVADHRVPFDPRDMCTLGDTLVVLGSFDQTIIHMYHGDSVVAEFGTAFASGHPLLQATLADGLVACDPEEGMVYAVSRRLPDVRGYGRGGDLRWRTTLPEFRTMAAYQLENGGVQFRHPKDGKSHYVTSMSVGSVLIIQFGPKERGQSFGLDQPRTVLLERRTGKLLGEQVDLPVVEVIGDEAFQPQWYPYPRLLVRSLAVSYGDPPTPRTEGSKP